MSPVDPVTSYPVAIIGGGLAGSAAASILAQAGFSPALIERDTFPRDKLCGEFLSGESGRLLNKIGCLQKLMKHDPPRITHGRFVSSSGKSLTVTLPEPAYGISRKLLDATLFHHAESLGARGFAGCEVRAIKRHATTGERVIEIMDNSSSRDAGGTSLRAALTIGAYGRHARIDHGLSRPFAGNLQSATGFKLHHVPAPGEAGRHALEQLGNTVEIYGLDGGYCGVCMIEDGRVNVCMLLRKNALLRVGSNNWSDIAAYLRSENQALAARLAGLSPVNDRVLSVSRMPFQMKEQAIDDDLLFIGDAAGMIAPLCGDGQAMALESGIMVAEMIINQFPDPEELSDGAVGQNSLALAWQHAWRNRFARRMRIGRVLQKTLLRPSAADAAIALLRRSPDRLTNYLARATRS